MGQSRLHIYLSVIVCLAVVSLLFTSLGSIRASQPSDLKKLEACALVFAAGGQEVSFKAQDLEDVEVGVLHAAPMVRVHITLMPQAAQRMQVFSMENLGERMQITWCDAFLSETFIRSVIGEELYITGFTAENADDFVRWFELHKKG